MKNIVRFLFTLTCSLLICSLGEAGEYKVLYVSSPDAVSIDGKILLVGDIFSDKDNLIWKDERQVIKASDTETHKQYIICAKSMEGKKSFSLSDYFLLTKPLASRSGEHNTLQGLSTFFQGEIIVDRHLVIPTYVRQDETHFFFLACEFPEETVNKAIPPVEGCLVLCAESIFKVDGKPVTPVATEAALYYYDAEKETSTCVSSGFLIVPVCE